MTKTVEEHLFRTPYRQPQPEARVANVAASEWWTAIGMVLVNRVASERITDTDA
ncbi:MAG: hypothetical protein ACRYGL_14520 [Janthinobacterium lividum]